MSVLDIIIWVVGGILISIYGFLSIRKYLKFKKAYNNYIEKGLTPIQAKEQAMKDIYPKKTKKMKNNNESTDTIFED